MCLWAKDFDHYKRLYIKVLKQYDLYIGEDDLFDI